MVADAAAVGSFRPREIYLNDDEMPTAGISRINGQIDEGTGRYIGNRCTNRHRATETDTLR